MSILLCKTGRYTKIFGDSPHDVLRRLFFPNGADSAESMALQSPRSADPRGALRRSSFSKPLPPPQPRSQSNSHKHTRTQARAHTHTHTHAVVRREPKAQNKTSQWHQVLSPGGLQGNEGTHKCNTHPHTPTPTPTRIPTHTPTQPKDASVAIRAYLESYLVKWCTRTTHPTPPPPTHS